jgi:hypothetical protein
MEWDNAGMSSAISVWSLILLVRKGDTSMFSLVHFSRVFPYVHPYLFPVQTTKSTDPLAATETVPADQASAAKLLAPIAAEDAAAADRRVQDRRLKSLHRRHLRSHRNDSLTYSGTFRHVADNRAI